MEITALNFLIVSLAVWRMSSLLANEEGPFHVFGRLRAYVEHLCKVNAFWGAFCLFDGLTCEWCNSVWIGLVIVPLWAWLGDRLVLVLLPLSLSAMVILIKYVKEALQAKGA